MTTRPALTINQRNLYAYFLNHRKKHGNTPCFVPRNPNKRSRDDLYLTALQRLEEYGLVRVDRSSPNYTGWILLPPST